METTLQKLDLRKEKVLDLKKKVGLGGQQAQVVLALDYSGSMAGLYANGNVQETVERVLPLGLAFDDNGEVDSYLFHNYSMKVRRSITQSNISGYVDKYLRKNDHGESREYGGTSYAPIIKDIVKQYSSVGLLSGLLGGGSKKLQYPVYVIFITDGDNDDKPQTEAAIREASNHGIFFQFIGIGSRSFDFLDKLDNLSGRKIDNANFFKCPDLSRTSDDELYGMMLKEFPSYIPQARAAGLIN